jgi:putative endonuclease
MNPSKAAGDRNRLGQAGEDAAAAHLEGQGFRILERRFACRLGEVDLIAEEGACLCFVEVRARRPGPVRPFETVGVRKQRRVVAAALEYLSQRGIAAVGERAMRFDVVEVNVARDGAVSVELCRNAFEAGE